MYSMQCAVARVVGIATARDHMLCCCSLLVCTECDGEEPACERPTVGVQSGWSPAVRSPTERVWHVLCAVAYPNRSAFDVEKIMLLRLWLYRPRTLFNVCNVNVDTALPSRALLCAHVIATRCSFEIHCWLDHKSHVLHAAGSACLLHMEQTECNTHNVAISVTWSST